MKLLWQNIDKEENDNKTKNEELAFFKPHLLGEVCRGLKL